MYVQSTNKYCTKGKGFGDLGKRNLFSGIWRGGLFILGVTGSRDLTRRRRRKKKKNREQRGKAILFSGSRELKPKDPPN